MNTLNRISLFTLVFAVMASFISAQEITKHTLLSYYPLHAGDIWQYEIKSYDVGPDPRISYATREVFGDTLMPNGLRYFIVNEIIGLYRTVTYQRVDSIDNVVRFYDDPYGSDNFDVPVYPLFKADTTFTWFDSSGLAMEVSFIDSLDGEQVKLLTLFRDFLVIEHFTFKDSIGITSYSVSEGGESNFRLIASVIDGQHRGVFTSIKDKDQNIKNFILINNYPNPFNLIQTIDFTLTKSSQTKVEIYSSLGRLIETLADKKYSSGKHRLYWNAISEPSGVYFIRLKTADGIFSIKSLIIK